MRQGKWFKRSRSEELSVEEVEQAEGGRRFGVWGRKKKPWRTGQAEPRRWDEPECSTVNPASPLAHGLF